VALIRRNNEAAEPEPTPVVQAVPGVKKDRPTPSRKEAEAARRQRVTPTYNKKEARRQASQQNRAARMRAIGARESAPEKVLMRDYIDSRFNIGEFLLPSVFIILAVSILGAQFRSVAAITTLAMYIFILGIIVDGYFMWRGYKKLLASRIPGASPKGLLTYGLTRSTQIRRFRTPGVRVKRGEKI
jgi:hypothetical protein